MSITTELCETRLSLAGFDAKTIARSPDSTIVPASVDVDAAGEHALSLVGELGASTLDRKLELHGTIGEGGMGVVRLGTQRALSREVAVKTLKPEHRSDRAALKLLREAWITGALEHPNVVPVYDIAVDGDGSPLVVLKKIEGVDWGSLMHDAGTVRDRFGAEDLLEWNLRTLLSVCNAVRFAHDRRVLHRDLKPENVMIGRFGEVYLVDWGIAVSLEDDGSGRLPLASEAIEMAGTPLYMAPEMLGGKEIRLSERTDIYLLGSILYEIVAGVPPHGGSSFMELVAAIVASDPVLPEGVPEELARIIRRAMDPDPDARFENAEQVRLAVEAFLQHRTATRLAERAEARFAELSRRRLPHRVPDHPAHRVREPALRHVGRERDPAPRLRPALGATPRRPGPARDGGRLADRPGASGDDRAQPSANGALRTGAPPAPAEVAPVGADQHARVRVAEPVADLADALARHRQPAIRQLHPRAQQEVPERRARGLQ